MAQYTRKLAPFCFILLFFGNRVSGQTSLPAFTSISAAAANSGQTLARDSIASGFGQNLASATAAPPSASLPTTLGGATVLITDSKLKQVSAPLYFVSPGQINYVIPAASNTGTASVMVSTTNGPVARGIIEIADVAPGLFTANSTGSGIAAAIALSIAADGTQSTQLVYQCTNGNCSPVPIALPPAPRQLYLELFGTGVRNRGTLASVTATINGTNVEVIYAGPQNQYPGLDQINLRLPSSLASVGVVPLQITVDGKLSNTVAIQIGGTAAAITARFDISSLDAGPFPSNAFTVPDPLQKTGIRVNLPLPDCTARPTDCETFQLLNQLDGFHVQPGIQVRFSGPVNTDTLRDGIVFVWLDNLTNEEKGLQANGHVTRINRVIYDPATNTVYAKPDEAFDQHRRYALVVTDAVRDLLGNPVTAGPDFTSCTQSPQNDYCRQLSQALSSISNTLGSRKPVSGSIFTTLSATTWLEKARRVVQNTPPAVKRNTTIDLGSYVAATLKRQTGVNPVKLEDFTIPLPSVIAAGAGRVAFASFQSPSFLSAQHTIATQPTGSEVPVPASTDEIAFHAFLPGGNKPAAGFPVIIFGHGLGDSSFGAPTLVAGTFARQGFATIAMNAVGHGYGPQTNLVLTNAIGQNTAIPAPGRGVDLNNDGLIGASEGCLLQSGIALRDCLRQTSIDLMQMVHLIRSGLDADGDGTVDLDPNRIYYAGQSLGAIYGTIFTAVEPEVRAAVLNVSGGSVIDIAASSQQLHPLARTILALHVPSLLNAGSDFNADIVFRDQPVKVNNVPGAIAIETYFEQLEWLQAVGGPIPYAPHLKLSPLPAVPPKRTLFQIARGDRTVPNPASSNLIRQAGGQDATVLYRHDIAKSVSVGLADNPHTFLVNISSPAGLAVALATQGQMAGYLNTDGNEIPDANGTALKILFLGKDVFERPAALPEDPGY